MAWTYFDLDKSVKFRQFEGQTPESTHDLATPGSKSSIAEAELQKDLIDAGKSVTLPHSFTNPLDPGYRELLERHVSDQVDPAVIKAVAAFVKRKGSWIPGLNEKKCGIHILNPRAPICIPTDNPPGHYVDGKLMPACPDSLPLRFLPAIFEPTATAFSFTVSFRYIAALETIKRP